VPDLNPKCIGTTPIPKDKSDLVPQLAKDCVQSLSKLTPSPEPVFEKRIGIFPPLEGLLRAILACVHLTRTNHLGAVDKFSSWTLYRMIKPKALGEGFRDAFDTRVEGSWFRHIRKYTRETLEPCTCFDARAELVSQHSHYLFLG
jgi:hypothetical protein